ncbi:MAG: Rne/Rng family ribonuclease [Candidatus Eisenbacteria sp.]|nr:Rne/Rng family ribonuclease [Candidatus Eisenbacteria bacterium]
MYREIIINAEETETRVAILEDHRLAEFFVERPEQRRIVGNIYKGIVNAVLPGMQAAFVDVGLEKSAFLHVSDLMESDLPDDEIGGDASRNGYTRSGHLPRATRIEALLTKGQEILVQITKEPIASKGARGTTQISLAGRFLVLMPNSIHLGISRKIEDRSERNRLREIVGPIQPADMGLIVRTVGEGKDAKLFKDDVRYLTRTWKHVVSRSRKRQVPAELHSEPELTGSLIRDLFSEEVDRVVVDCGKQYKEIRRYVQGLMPELKERIHLYEGDAPVFDHYGVETEIEQMLNRRIPLRRGAYIAIDQTEALTTIDVNTGRFRGASDQEETIVITNLEAARESARQMRMRDIGGIIVIDFIDMEKESNRRRVFEELRKNLRADRSRTKILPISEFGLVQMTRQRVRPSHLHFFSESCSCCGGLGRVLSPETMVSMVERCFHRLTQRTGERNIAVHLHPEVAIHMLSNRIGRVQDLEKEFGLTIEIVDDPAVGRQEIRMYSVSTGEDLTRKVLPKS